MKHRNLNPESIPEDVYDDWDVKFNDLMAEIDEFIEEAKP
jgi:hypothetical protein